MNGDACVREASRGRPKRREQGTPLAGPGSPPQLASWRGFMGANLEAQWETRSQEDFTSFLNSLAPRCVVHRPTAAPGPLPPHRRGRGAQTCGVPGVDDTQHLGVTVVFGLPQGPPELVDVQGPAVLLVQVVVHLDGVQLRDDCRVEGVLRDGDHHPRPGLAAPGNQDLQDCLQRRSRTSQGPRHAAPLPLPSSPCCPPPGRSCLAFLSLPALICERSAVRNELYKMISSSQHGSWQRRPTDGHAEGE